MKIIVFGGSGFLGSHVCAQLSKAGHEVTIFDIKENDTPNSNYKFIKGDILDEDAVSKAIKGKDVVFNFSGIADIDENMIRPVDSVRYNILGNTIILEASHQAKVKRYVFASSVYVYSKSGGFYRCSKQASEQYIENYHECFGLEYTILRYGSLYGPRSDSRNAIYRYVKQALTEKKMTYQGSAEALREYIHVEDAAKASVEILKPDYANQSIILTGHQPMKVGNLFKMIKEMLAKEIDFEFLEKKDLAHYEVTPYNFSPKMGYKYAAPLHVDLGQGILKVIEELHREQHPELHNVHGVLVEEKD